MDATCAYAALQTALTYGSQLSFIAFIKVLIELLRPDIVDKEHRVKIVSPENIFHSYDYVIIGGGSAGSVLANRLTEDHESTVFLLEAGGDEPVISDVPAMCYYLQRTDLDWGFRTEPSSKYCLGMNNNQCLWSRGKALGGCSMHNRMMYHRGNRRDYDNWEKLGNPGWGYEHVLPYFKKSENMTIPSLRNSPYHGTNGYLTIEKWRNTTPLPKYILAAGREIGYDEVDVNGASQTGFSYIDATLRNGLRCSTAKAFLRSASHRENLYVSTDSMVDKILVNEDTKTAYGVQFRRGGKEYIVYARKEVILSAGAIQSPKILMLSGIGPKKHLTETGIRCIHDSPGVGENLQDHVILGGLDYLIDAPWKSSAPPNATSHGLISMSDATNFMQHMNGSLYDVVTNEAVAFVNTKYNKDTPDFPDIGLVISGAGDNEDDAFTAQTYNNLRDDFVESLFGSIMNKGSYSIWASLMRPKSRGYVKLRDANPDHHPRIVPNYFEDPHDLDVLIEGAKIVHQLSETKVMKQFNARPNPNRIPQCAHLNYPSDDYLRCQARYYSRTYWHLTSTCKMGPANDSMAVVDPRLRVYGVKGLRVVDASIMPEIVSSATNAATIMIAEKASDMIKEDHRGSY